MRFATLGFSNCPFFAVVSSPHSVGGLSRSRPLPGGLCVTTADGQQPIYIYHICLNCYPCFMYLWPNVIKYSSSSCLNIHFKP